MTIIAAEVLSVILRFKIIVFGHVHPYAFFFLSQDHGSRLTKVTKTILDHICLLSGRRADSSFTSYAMLLSFALVCACLQSNLDQAKLDLFFSKF